MAEPDLTVKPDDWLPGQMRHIESQRDDAIEEANEARDMVKTQIGTIATLTAERDRLRDILRRLYAGLPTSVPTSADQGVGLSFWKSEVTLGEIREALGDVK